MFVVKSEEVPEIPEDSWMRTDSVAVIKREELMSQVRELPGKRAPRTTSEELIEEVRRPDFRTVEEIFREGTTVAVRETVSVTVEARVTLAEIADVRPID